MSTSTRKQQAREAREDLILREAQAILLERGYLGLTMDRIAQATDYSKGTIYQHFPNKEEVVMALVTQTSSRRSAMFERAATFRGRSRERMAAIGQAAELFVRLYPDHMRSEQIVRAASVRDKTTPERRRVLEACESRCMNVAKGVVRDAIAAGDLELDPERVPELAFGLWSMHFGAFNLAVAEWPLDELGVDDPLASLRVNQHVLLDGYGWQPLFAGAFDWDATNARIAHEVFAGEWARLAGEA
ncbi:MAG: TetR/AcrR family transcriptional regulator [Planctomycetes bacterium]|nr:TetR/AcrR family transcriptional regulator [Planctomycetota bacterium]